MVYCLASSFVTSLHGFLAKIKWMISLHTHPPPSPPNILPSSKTILYFNLSYDFPEYKYIIGQGV